MGKFIFSVIGAVASLVLAESLICNKCSFGMMGNCIDLVDEQCLTNSSVCYSGKSSFPVFPDSMSLKRLGCKENSTGCEGTTNGTLMGFTYETQIVCCSTDNCNKLTVSSAPTTKMTLTAAVTGAILTAVWGNIL